MRLPEGFERGKVSQLRDPKKGKIQPSSGGKPLSFQQSRLRAVIPGRDYYPMEGSGTSGRTLPRLKLHEEVVFKRGVDSVGRERAHFVLRATDWERVEQVRGEKESLIQV